MALAEAMDRTIYDLEGRSAERKRKVETPEERLLREGLALRSAALFVSWMDNPDRVGEPVSTSRDLASGSAHISVLPAGNSHKAVKNFATGDMACIG